jgi:hypothetical protein
MQRSGFEKMDGQKKTRHAASFFTPAAWLQESRSDTGQGISSW